MVCTESLRASGTDSGQAAAAAGCDVVAPIPESWRGALGGRPADGHVTGRIIGDPAKGVIAILGGISAGRFVANEGDTRGWWGRVVGAGLPIDLDEAAVLGLEWSSSNADGLDGQAVLTPADQARLLALLMDAAGIERLSGLIGASYGGMAALEFARQFPERVDQMAVIAAAHRPSVMGGAWRGIQRRILDFAISAERPEEGVSLARQLAMTTYRAPEEFSKRFDPIAEADPRFGATAEVCGYLENRGEAYLDQMSAQRFLSLSASVDLHNVAPEDISTPSYLIATTTDWLNPPSDTIELGERLAGPSVFRLIESPCGHDAFLVEQERISALMAEFVSGSWRQ